MPKWLNIPNLFTLLRLALAPFVIREILLGHHLLALELFSIAAVTDALDGELARRFRATTAAGAYLDPIADKCLLSGVFLAQAISRILPWWLVVLIFARDLYILAGAAWFLIYTRQRRFPPSRWGKLSTFVQIATAVIWMGQSALSIPLLKALAPVTIWPCAAITVWSGLDYTYRGIQLARSKGDEANREPAGKAH